MFRRECSLCGGKLDSNNICKECGLDNNKCDANYVINKSSCDNLPLTHVHEEKHSARRDKKKEKNDRAASGKYVRQDVSCSKKMVQKPKRKKYRVLSKAAVIIIICSIAAELVSIIPDIFEEIGGSGLEEITNTFQDDSEYDYGYDYDSDYDPYEYVTRDISTEGEEYTTSFGMGEYIVGVHIPEGIYTCSTDGGYASISVEDDENSIWLYEWIDESQPEIIDIRLYNGAIVEISGDDWMEMTAENAQIENMTSMANPIHTTMVMVGNGTVAGLHFEPGVYDISAEEGYGSITVMIFNENGEVIQEKYIWLDADYNKEKTYKNLVLPENAEISWDTGMDLEVSLTPSAVIKDTNYLEYYEN